MKILNSLLAAGAMVATAGAQELSWSDLARQPEFWPTECAVLRAMQSPRETLAAGQKVYVVALSADQIRLATASGLSFSLKPGDTDALAVAQSAWSKLTPKQRSLTYASLLQRKDLWPYRVNLTQPIKFNTGRMNRGESVILSNATGNRLVVFYEKAGKSIEVAPTDTDLIVGARQRIENSDAFPGRVIEALRGKLVNAATGAVVELDATAEPRYYAFYHGAGWCQPCREFSPSLLKSYQQLKPVHPEFELIFVSDDKSPADLRAYAKAIGFSWRAVPTERYDELSIVTSLFGKKIPQLVVTDRHGQVLLDSDQLDELPASLKALTSLLAKSPGKNAQKAL